MSIGERIKLLREEKKLSQAKLAEKIDVSFQAISSWERDEYLPDTENLIKLSKELDISLSSLVEDKYNFKVKDALYDWKHMKTYVKTSINNYKLDNASKALNFAIKAHEGIKRKKSDIPYIYHPLNMVCHLLALNIIDDNLIAATLLHDVIEDCDVRYEDLPVNEYIKDLVKLLTHEKVTDDKRKKVLNDYYKKIKKNPDACLIKCIDRCNNLTTMSWGLSRARIFRMIEETEEYILPLLTTLKDTVKYNNAYWLLSYQMESMLDIYKRLL